MFFKLSGLPRYLWRDDKKNFVFAEWTFWRTLITSVSAIKFRAPLKCFLLLNSLAYLSLLIGSFRFEPVESKSFSIIVELLIILDNQDTEVSDVISGLIKGLSAMVKWSGGGTSEGLIPIIFSTSICLLQFDNSIANVVPAE